MAASERTVSSIGEPVPAGRGRARRLGPAPLAWHFAAARRAWLLPDGARPELQEFLRGLQAYWHHPYRRRAPALPVLWACGATRLLDYGPAGAPPVLAVPSLINRAYILDLMPECSLLGFLRARGFRPLLLDWGEPGAAERRMSFDDHVLARLGGALAWWIRAHGTQVNSV